MPPRTELCSVRNVTTERQDWYPILGGGGGGGGGGGWWLVAVAVAVAAVGVRLLVRILFRQPPLRYQLIRLCVNPAHFVDEVRIEVCHKAAVVSGHHFA